jgi:hypothetical protein
MAKKQINIRLPDNSIRQIADLQSKLGMTQVQILMLALDRMAKQERIKEHGTQEH